MQTQSRRHPTRHRRPWGTGAEGVFGAFAGGRWPCWLTLAGLLICLPAWAAELVPLQGGWSAAWLEAGRTRLVAVTATGEVRVRKLPVALTCALSAPWGETYGFAGEQVLRIGAEGHLEPLQGLPGVVRRARWLGEEGLLLLGGERRDGVLRGAQVGLWNPRTGTWQPCGQVLPAWNAFELSRWGRPMGAGTHMPGTADLVISVRKTAPFDPVERLRPFVFRFRPDRHDLLPLWKGTSTARPSLMLEVADVEGDGISELVAVEETGDGQRLLAAYGFSGLMQLEGVSRPGRFGQALAVLPGPSSVGDLLCAFDRESGRFVAHGRGNQRDSRGVCLLEGRLQTESVAGAPRAWTALLDRSRRVLVLDGRGRVRALRWEAVAPEGG